MAVAVGEAAKTRWPILLYQLPSEPSRHRVAVRRKLRSLEAIYLQDGAAALPGDDVTREQLEWLQFRVRQTGGEATLWNLEGFAQHRRREQGPHRGYSRG